MTEYAPRRFVQVGLYSSFMRFRPASERLTYRARAVGDPLVMASSQMGEWRLKSPSTTAKSEKEGSVSMKDSTAALRAPGLLYTLPTVKS